MTKKEESLLKFFDFDYVYIGNNISVKDKITLFKKLCENKPKSSKTMKFA